jgi:hypothetical protein
VALLEPIAVTLSVVSVFERMDVEYVVGGSLAHSAGPPWKVSGTFPSVIHHPVIHHPDA